MKLRGMIGFLFLMAAGYAIFDITGASPANYIIVKDFAATADVHLIPFMDIWDILCTGDIYNILRNIGGNIALFMPIGFVLPLTWDAFRKLSRTIVFGVCVSIWIEINQLFNYRATVVDDVLLNACGVWFGWLCAKVILHFIHFHQGSMNRWYAIPAVAAMLVPYLLQTGYEMWFYLTQW